MKKIYEKLQKIKDNKWIFNKSNFRFIVLIIKKKKNNKRLKEEKLKTGNNIKFNNLHNNNFRNTYRW